jgi:hypothetical protein
VFAVGRDQFHKQINTLHDKTLMAVEPSIFRTG